MDSYNWPSRPCMRVPSPTSAAGMAGRAAFSGSASKDCHASPFRPKRLSEVVVCQQASQNAFLSVFRRDPLAHFLDGWPYGAKKSTFFARASPTNILSLASADRREPKKNRRFCTSKTHFLRENDTRTATANGTLVRPLSPTSTACSSSATAIEEAAPCFSGRGWPGEHIWSPGAPSARALLSHATKCKQACVSIRQSMPAQRTRCGHSVRMVWAWAGICAPAF